jgi:transposase-like protein
MKRKRHSPEEIIRKLRTAEEAVAGGRTVEEACRIMAMNMATCQRWKGQYSGVKTDTTTADRIHRWTIGHPPNSRLHV